MTNTETQEPRTIVSTDVPDSVRERLKVLAQKNQRSLAGEVRYILTKHAEGAPDGSA